MSQEPSSARGLRARTLEGAVIVFSILLAFGLDALWEERKQEREADLALASLRSELEVNLEACDAVHQHHFHGVARFGEILELPDEAVLAMSDAEATEGYYAMCMPRTFDPALGTTNTVVSSGTFNILRDPELRSELDVFLNLTEDTREDVANMLHYMRRIGEHEVSLGGPWGDPEQNCPGASSPDTSFLGRISGAELLRLRSDATYVGLVKLYQSRSAWYGSELERLSGQIRGLRAMLDARQG